MKSIQLIEPTGIKQIDDYLLGLVGLAELAFEGRIRSIFIIGSYATGGYTPTSDIDYALVLKEEFVWDERNTKQFQRFQLCLSKLPPVVFDLMFFGSELALYLSDNPENFPNPLTKLVLKHHSSLLYGEDIRPKIQLSSKSEELMDALAAPLNWIKQIHYDSLEATIQVPLSHPQPGDEFLGYGDPHKLSVFVLHIARALVYLETYEFLFDKRKIAEAYRQFIGDEYSEMVAEVGQQCFHWGHTPSENEAERILYRRLCERLTDFQNHFLSALTERHIPF